MKRCRLGLVVSFYKSMIGHWSLLTSDGGSSTSNAVKDGNVCDWVRI